MSAVEEVGLGARRLADFFPMRTRLLTDDGRVHAD
jgi:hypothetical protein